ncbi:hypothetical protein CAR_c04230 [Carnobacterium sp. 17-4]|uniref:hypothetical protein n=1 Tax=Carnobacterium sp. (strain 17-4) TaxID=208596 RepID=UPI0002059056|nr:hypothetical protein [Carnobacterium sp. 17-4]AEB29143.1 hypothetical protein CAR_c04230 [Carnobacterium sp. 17-4]
MLIDVNDMFFNELEEVSTSLDMTVGEYLENLHEKNQNLKHVLLEDKEGLQEFVKKYHTLLDDLFILNREALAIVSEHDDAELMKPVFLKLSKIANGDITVLSKLYDVYVQASEQQIVSSSTLE